MTSKNDLDPQQPWSEHLLAELVTIRGDAEHVDGIKRVHLIVARELRALGFEAEVGELHLRAQRSAQGSAPSLLLVTHADTVVLPDAQTSLRVSGDRLMGHGVADCRGGSVVMLAALRALAPELLSGLHVQVVSCGDEEIGSPDGRRLFEDIRDIDTALVFEPARASGAVVHGRKGQLVFDIQADGVAAHAGNDAKTGASAILALSQLVCALDQLQLSRPETTINVGLIKGGSAFNVVPPHAEMSVDVRFWQDADRDHVIDMIRDWRDPDPRVALSVTRRIERPAWRPDPANVLWDPYSRAARAEDVDPIAVTAGGGSDANWLAARGIAVLDGMGAQGGGFHTLDEYILRNSLAQRSRIAADVIKRWWQSVRR